MRRLVEQQTADPYQFRIVNACLAVMDFDGRRQCSFADFAEIAVLQHGDVASRGGESDGVDQVPGQGLCRLGGLDHHSARAVLRHQADAGAAATSPHPGHAIDVPKHWPG